MTRYLLPILFLAACDGCREPDKVPSLAEDEAGDELLTAARTAVAQGCLSPSATASLLNVLEDGWSMEACQDATCGAVLRGTGVGCGDEIAIDVYTSCETGGPSIQVVARQDLCGDEIQNLPSNFTVTCATAAGILVGVGQPLLGPAYGFVTRIEPGWPLVMSEGAVYTLRDGAEGPWAGYSPDELKGLTRNLIQDEHTATPDTLDCP